VQHEESQHASESAANGEPRELQGALLKRVALSVEPLLAEDAEQHHRTPVVEQGLALNDGVQRGGSPEAVQRADHGHRVGCGEDGAQSESLVGAPRVVPSAKVRNCDVKEEGDERRAEGHAWKRQVSDRVHAAHEDKPVDFRR
jgi:hypothetical protein